MRLVTRRGLTARYDSSSRLMVSRLDDNLFVFIEHLAILSLRFRLSEL
jgi:hypothetical protein